MEKHSELPWIIDPDESMPLAVIQDNADGMGVCEIGERNEENLANAALIVRCVNAHDDLVKAVEACLAMLDNRHWNGDMVAHARAALAKARADQRK